MHNDKAIATSDTVATSSTRADDDTVATSSSHEAGTPGDTIGTGAAVPTVSVALPAGAGTGHDADPNPDPNPDPTVPAEQDSTASNSSARRERRPCALYASTEHALKAAVSLRAALPQAHLYVAEALLAQAPEGARPAPEPLGPLLHDTFTHYDGHVLLCDIDVAIRLTAPLLRSAETDPAVVCADASFQGGQAGEGGSVEPVARFALCLLPGLQDRGAQLTHAVAQALGAQAVMPAVAPGAATFPVEALGHDLGWTLDDAPRDAPRNLDRAQAAVRDRASVMLVQECGEPHFWPLDRPLPPTVGYTTDIDQVDPAAHAALLIATDRELRATHPAHWERAVIYRPKTLVLGLACDDDASPEMVERGVASLLARHRLSPRSVRALATVESKAEAPALRQLSSRHGWPLQVQTLEDRDEATSVEPMLERARGAAEVAALWAAAAEQLLVAEHTYSEPGTGRSMTCAIARVLHTPRSTGADLC